MILGKKLKTGLFTDAEDVFVRISTRAFVRHGLITGSTGQGKTVSTRVLLELLSDLGVPTFMVDVKGDLGGLEHSGHGDSAIKSKVKSLGLTDFKHTKFPVKNWGKKSVFKTTVEELGPMFLSRMLGLKEAQERVCTMAFTLARDKKHPMKSLADFLALIKHFGSAAYQYGDKPYGHASPATLDVIVGKIKSLQYEGADVLFGDKPTDIAELMLNAKDGRGMINLLDGRILVKHPNIYATLILWLLDKFYAELPEIGSSLDKPKFVFFIDEAHLLFEDSRKELLRKIESIVRLIRSKGVGIFFISQSPKDIPENILGQLGNKVQHGLMAFSPAEAKIIRSLAESFRQNPELDLRKIMLELGTGEAVVSFIQDDGKPSVAQYIAVVPPRSKINYE